MSSLDKSFVFYDCFDFFPLNFFVGLTIGVDDSLELVKIAIISQKIAVISQDRYN